MPSWLFIGPTLLSGIGQVTKKYANLVGGDYIEFYAETPSKKYDYGFAFVLPIIDQLDKVDRHLTKCRKRFYMTVCETESVHPLYKLLLNRYQTLYVPSEFCLDVFRRQFPEGNWKLLRHTVDGAPLPPPVTPEYTFYTIGNMYDLRKNIRMLLECFLRLDIPNVRLVLKATCREPYVCKIPGVTVINGLLSDEEIETIHRTCHCYVNCSFSEGVGMGAVEAAVRDKPVIITDYGGLKEYIPSTPFVVESGRMLVGQDDFLYTKNMVWGQPVMSSLLDHMRTCARERIVTWNHARTRELTGEVVGRSFEDLCIQ